MLESLELSLSYRERPQWEDAIFVTSRLALMYAECGYPDLAERWLNAKDALVAFTEGDIGYAAAMSLGRRWKTLRAIAMAIGSPTYDVLAEEARLSAHRAYVGLGLTAPEAH